MPLTALPPATAATITVTATDRAGNVAASSPLAFETPPAAAAHRDHRGAGQRGRAGAGAGVRRAAQPRADAVSLAGLRLEDAKGGDDLPAETLAPGGYALVVPSGYDPAQGRTRRRARGRCCCASIRASARTGSRTAARSCG